MVKENAIEIYSTQNDGNSVIAERLIRKFKKQNLLIYDLNIKKCVSW